MCKEADETPAAASQEEPKVVEVVTPESEEKKDQAEGEKPAEGEIPAGLPEGAAPTTVTNGVPDAAQPEEQAEQGDRPTNLDHQKETIANEQDFKDKDLTPTSQ